MKLLEKIKFRICELKNKEIDSKLTKDESIELGKLYIAEEIIHNYSGSSEIKDTAFLDLNECNDFFKDNDKELIIINWDYVNSIHVVYYREI